MGFLVSILFVVLFVILLVFLFVLGFIRSIFSFGRRKNNFQSENNDSTYQQSKKRSKIFDKKEGEYADFEEVK